jgi:hypothetical protein
MNAKRPVTVGFLRSVRAVLLSVASFGAIATPDLVLAQDTRTVVRSPGDAPAPDQPLTVRREPDGRVSIRAVRVSGLRVDGSLDEDVYSSVPPIEGFIQMEPREGDPASEATEAWVFFDDRNIYIAARCQDSHPERAVLTEMRRDNSTAYDNENFTVVFDTFHDKRNGYYFLVTGLGALRDGLITDESSSNYDWNTVFDARVKRHDRGYDLEMVIPFKSIRYVEGPGQVWMINLRRVVKWKNEEDFVTQMPKSYGNSAVFHYSLAAALYGLEVPAVSRNLEFKPYAISDLRTDRLATPGFSNDPGADAGFDVKYGVTRSVIADLTYNTDFAQVEDDQQQVNLTRFNLYYPEKRECFLEGRGIFNFGSAGGSGGEGTAAATLFFSRRIGLQSGCPRRSPRAPA